MAEKAGLSTCIQVTDVFSLGVSLLLEKDKSI